MNEIGPDVPSPAQRERPSADVEDQARTAAESEPPPDVVVELRVQAAEWERVRRRRSGGGA